MDDDELGMDGMEWIKGFIPSPQSTGFQSFLDASTTSEVDQAVRTPLPLNLAFPTAADLAVEERGRTPVGFRKTGMMMMSRNRGRLSALLEATNEASSSSLLTYTSTPKSRSCHSNAPLPGPNTPRYPLKILRRIVYEDRPTAYLVEWNKPPEDDELTEEDKENPTQTWEYGGDRLPQGCSKLVDKFEAYIGKDANRAWECTDYEVAAILDKTISGKGLRYLVRWVGWRAPTWERAEFLTDYDYALREFEELNVEAEQPVNKKRNRKRKLLEEEKEEAREEEQNPDAEQMIEESTSNCTQKWPKSTRATAHVVVKAVRVLNKLDVGKGNPSYLVLWPEEAGVRSTRENTSESWEQRLSKGNFEAITEFEQALKAGNKDAIDAVLYQVERVEDRRKHVREEAPRYLVRWVGYKERSWTEMKSLESFTHLLVAYALGRPRTLSKGQKEAQEIVRNEMSDEVKRHFNQTGERLNRELGLN